MSRMVLQAILFTVLAVGFIVTKSDGLRSAAQSGDISALAAGGSSVSLLSEFSNMAGGGDTMGARGQEPWYAKLDPRQLWRDQPKTIRLNPKTITVSPRGGEEERDLAAQMAAHGLKGEVVSIVKLD